MYPVLTGREACIQHKKMDRSLRRLCKGRNTHQRHAHKETIDGSHQAASLLPIGVTRIEGDFEKDDIVRIFDHEGNQIGVGRIGYNSEKARSLIGKQGARPLIHYDYLYLD